MDDAEVLLAGERWRGAMYLAGYAVECRLKYKLMQKWKCFTLEELEDKLASKGFSGSPFTHNLDALLELLECQVRMKQSQAVWNAFSRANRWRPSWRYSPDPASEQKAEVFLAAAKEVVSWIENNS